MLIVLGISIFRLDPRSKDTKSSKPSRKTRLPSPFVQTDGAMFVLNGRPYRFIGLNFWHGAYLAADIIPGGRARLIRELDLLARYGVTNLRITAATERSKISHSVRPAFQTAPNQYNEQLLRGLDILLDEMAKRQMKAVLVMGNYWEWSGGMAQYVSWTTGTPVIDPAIDNQSGAFMAYAASFYDQRQAWKPYLAYMKHLIERLNTVNNTPYKDDPTIMSWQLANEPRPHPRGRKDATRITGFFNWIESTAKQIRRLAPKHLVSIGNEGTVGCLDDKTHYLKAHQPDSIDYMTFHIWPKNWRWYESGDETRTLTNAIEKTRRYMDRHVAMAETLNKPLVLEEFGLARDDEATRPDATVTARNQYLKAVFNAIEAQKSMNGPLAGCNIWSWGGEGRAHNEDAIWVEGTDFTGDPPQEPQGLNSIFDTDRITLELIREHAARLKP